MSITVTLSHDKETLETLRDEWLDLQRKSSATSITLTWHEIYIWYKYFGDLGELWLMTAHENNRLIGIAPLMKVKERPDRGFAWQQLEFITACHDYANLDFIIETGYEEHVIPLFIGELYKYRPQWDVISLKGLADTKTINILQQSDYEWIERPENNMIVPSMLLPDTVEEWMQHAISRNHRQKLRRYRRKLDKQFPDQWSIKQVHRPDELDAVYDQLIRLNQARWEAVGQPGSFPNQKRKDYIRESIHSLLKNDYLRMYYMDINNQICAVYFCTQYRGRVYFQIVGADHNMTDIPVGYVVLEHCINQAIAEGCSEFSFGEGKEVYKYSFGGVDQVQRAFRLINSPRVKLQLKTVNLLRGVKSQLREITSDEPTNEVNES